MVNVVQFGRCMRLATTRALAATVKAVCTLPQNKGPDLCGSTLRFLSCQPTRFEVYSHRFIETLLASRK